MNSTASPPLSHARYSAISLINMKGGVGKTTLAVNLAWNLCRRFSKKVLLIDLDPQFNASQYLMKFDEWEEHKRTKGTIADILLEPRSSSISISKKKKRKKSSPILDYVFKKETAWRGGQLDILPAELALAQAVKNPHGVAYKLEKSLASVQLHYDYVIIDCAPTDSVLTDTALMASDFILVPVKPDRFSVLGYAQIQETLEGFRETYPDPHKVSDLGVVFTQVRGDSSIENECTYRFYDSNDKLLSIDGELYDRLQVNGRITDTVSLTTELVIDQKMLIGYRLWRVKQRNAFAGLKVDLVEISKEGIH